MFLFQRIQNQFKIQADSVIQDDLQNEYKLLKIHFSFDLDAICVDMLLRHV